MRRGALLTTQSNRIGRNAVVARHTDALMDPFPSGPNRPSGPFSPAGPPAPAAPGRGRWVAWGAVGGVLVLALAFCLPFVLPGVLPGARGALPWFPAAACTRTTVIQVVSTPLVGSAATDATAPLAGRRLSDGSCLTVQVREQAADDTVSSAAVLPPSRAPQLWISDSSLWLPRVNRWKQRVAGSFGSTPVIMVSNGNTIYSPANAEWVKATHTWADIFGHAQPLAVPDAAGNADGQLAMIALWQATGRGASADRAVAAATLAARRTSFASEADALSAVISPPSGQKETEAPFVVSTEQAMVALNRDSTREVLAPLYGAGGSPFLDFPIVRLAEDQQDAVHRAATDLVLAALTSPGARKAAHDLGLRDPQGGDAPTSMRGLPGAVTRLVPPSAADLTRFLTRWSALAIPSRILVAVDVSLSMRTLVPGTTTSRLELAGAAAARVGDLLPGASSAGLWAFAMHMDGDLPYRALSPVAPQDAAESGTTHRRVLQKELTGLRDQLTPGGTGLYVTALAAVRAQRAGFDVRDANSVVLFTDGTNENDPRMTLDQLTGTLRQEAIAAPDKPVRLVCIGIGTGIDLPALKAIADATGGSAYQARNAAELQNALYDAMSHRA